ncbi:uncharacterized protein HD556DRAFT_508579 [Suillus plorans]|uniref:Uncharacterized protein n=1 Tax=Suillus plorans TaxID=116603 RepID=A0A9P7APA8_9AGAM|nr:uncharacterized protein HD556DRAFT_508579 [Suillus plorans]KAG1793492.1 hypothetical protein HD556DRAFT_508579 [Suillus plorans]
MRPSSSIELHWSSIPPGHSYRFASLQGLALNFCVKIRTASNVDPAKSWATSAEQFHHGSASLAHQTVLRFLAAHCRSIVLLTPFRCDEAEFIILCKRMCFRAMFANCNGFFTTAVELVELGRGVFWTQLEHVCIPLDKLFMSGDAGATLAAEFKQLSLRLRNAFSGLLKINTSDR